MIVGVNGGGKTTSLGMFVDNGFYICIYFFVESYSAISMSKYGDGNNSLSTIVIFSSTTQLIFMAQALWI